MHQLVDGLAGPGLKIHFQQSVIKDGIWGLATLGLQQARRRRSRPLQWGAVDGLDAHVLKRAAQGPGLLMPLLAEVREIIAALDPPFLVETAETVADQKNTKGHGSASGRGHRMEAAFRGDNRGQLNPAGAQFPTTGFPALEGTSGGLVPRFGRFHLVVGLDGQPLATFGGTGPEPSTAGADASC